MLYHEDGMVMEVEIVEDKSDKEWERYTLKVIRIVQESAVYNSPEIGEIFTCQKQREATCCGLWHLDN